MLSEIARHWIFKGGFRNVIVPGPGPEDPPRPESRPQTSRESAAHSNVKKLLYRFHGIIQTVVRFRIAARDGDHVWSESVFGPHNWPFDRPFYTYLLIAK